MTQQEFADCIKIAPATLSSVFTGRTRPTLSVVEAIKNKFTNISTDWLMFGSGPMLTTRNNSKDVSTAINAGGDDSVQSTDGVGDVHSGDIDWGDDDVENGMINGSVLSNSLSDTNTKQDANASGQGNMVSAIEVKKCDTRQRRIVEIRIFYDDQTWETFLPKQ